MDHYCVTAPSSSRWPHRWGTRLEETGYYTRDLKLASEPEADLDLVARAFSTGPNDLARPCPHRANSLCSLCRTWVAVPRASCGSPSASNRATSTPTRATAIQGWGRVLRLVRDDMLAAEPIAVDVEADGRD